MTLARAESFTEVLKIPLDGLVVDGCDEPIELSGSLTVRFHATFDANGGLTVLDAASPAGLSGTGLVSGATYRGVGITVNTGHLSSVPTGDPIDHLTGTLVDRTRIVGPGGLRTLEFKTTFHVTKVNAENVVIFEHGPYITCK